MKRSPLFGLILGLSSVVSCAQQGGYSTPKDTTINNGPTHPPVPLPAQDTTPLGEVFLNLTGETAVAVHQALNLPFDVNGAHVITDKLIFSCVEGLVSSGPAVGPGPTSCIGKSENSGEFLSLPSDNAIAHDVYERFSTEAQSTGSNIVKEVRLKQGRFACWRLPTKGTLEFQCQLSGRL